MRGRFDDCKAGRKEEKGHRCALRQWAHLLLEAGWEAKRKMEDMGVEVARKVAILGIAPGSRYAVWNVEGRGSGGCDILMW